MPFVPRVVVEQMRERAPENELVIQLGQIVSVDMGTKTFQLKDCSDQIVLVLIRQQLDGPLLENMWVEVHGAVTGLRSMEGSNIIILRSSLFRNFDKALYTEAVKLINSKNIYPELLVDDKHQHHGFIKGQVELVGEAENYLEDYGITQTFLDL